MSRPLASRQFLAILLVGLLVRVGVMLPSVGRPLEDPDGYLALAESVAKGRGFAIDGRLTAYRPPLYPWLLVPLAAGGWGRVPNAILALHLALGLGTIVLTAEGARRWGLSPTRSMIAAAIVSCDPVLAVQSRLAMTETLAAFLLAATLVLATRPRGAWWAALGLGLLILCRSSFLPAAIVAAAAAGLAGPGSRRERIGRVFAMAVGTLLVLTPWTIRNARVFGEPIVGTTHGGYTLALANNATYYREILDGPPGSVWGGDGQHRWWDGLNRQTAEMSEPRADRWLRDQTLCLIGQRPRTFSRACLARLGRFWALAPASGVYPPWVRWATACWTLPLWWLLGTGLGRRSVWQWSRVLAPSLLIALTLVHCVYWSDLRMRAPLVPAIALIAAAGAPSWFEGRAKKAGRTGSEQGTEIH